MAGCWPGRETVANRKTSTLKSFNCAFACPAAQENAAYVVIAQGALWCTADVLGGKAGASLYQNYYFDSTYSHFRVTTRL
jgi:hypothetical protein